MTGGPQTCGKKEGCSPGALLQDLWALQSPKGLGTVLWKAEGPPPQDLTPGCPGRPEERGPVSVLGSQTGNRCLVTRCPRSRDSTTRSSSRAWGRAAMGRRRTQQCVKGLSPARGRSRRPRTGGTLGSPGDGGQVGHSDEEQLRGGACRHSGDIQETTSQQNVILFLGC